MLVGDRNMIHWLQIKQVIRMKFRDENIAIKLISQLKESLIYVNGGTEN